MRFSFCPAGIYAACLVAAATASPALAHQSADAHPDPQALFNTLDADHNDTLSRDELSHLRSAMAARRAARIDTNNDGQIDKTEYETAAMARADRHFDRMDRDGNGHIGVDALDMHHAHPGHKDRRHDADRNADNPGHKPMFEAIDTDANGAISP